MMGGESLTDELRDGHRIYYPAGVLHADENLLC
jgi:hypothetical protein